GQYACRGGGHARGHGLHNGRRVPHNGSSQFYTRSGTRRPGHHLSRSARRYNAERVTRGKEELLLDVIPICDWHSLDAEDRVTASQLRAQLTGDWLVKHGANHASLYH